MNIGDKVAFDLGLQRREGVITDTNHVGNWELKSVKVSFMAGDKQVIIKRKIDRDRVETIEKGAE